jgi:hypothetical protein
MSIQTLCVHCGKQFQIKDEFAGKRLKCSCGAVLSVPAPEPRRRVAEPRPASEPALSVLPAETETAVTAQAPPPAPSPVQRTAPPPPREHRRQRRADPEERRRVLMDIVYDLARKHNCKEVLKHLGRFNDEQLLTLRRHFARDLEPDEEPLALLDTSFWGSGKSGLLVTDRRLYSSTLIEPIPLEEIRVVGHEKPSVSDQFLGNQQQPTLLVNGVTVFSGKANFDFWCELLPELGDAIRGEEEYEAGPLRDRPPRLDEDELVRIGAAALCSGANPRAVARQLTDDGMHPEDARETVQELERLRSDPRPNQASKRLLGGLGLVLLGIVLSVALSGSDGVTVFFGLILCGLVLAGSGAYRLLVGSPPMKTQELLQAWRKSRGRRRR